MRASVSAGDGHTLWSPEPDRVERAVITRFARWVEQQRAVRVTDSYDQLWRWSVDDVEGFWSAVWQFFDIQADGAVQPVLADRTMPGARWFPNVRLNYAEHVFRDRDPEAVALRFASESADVQAWTWARLRQETGRIATGLRRLGVGRGDRVAAYLPNIPESVAAFLACSTIGAVWSCAAPEFGARSVIDRFAQIEPAVLLAVDGYDYGGRTFDRRDAIGEMRAQIPTLEHVVVLDRLGHGAPDGAMAWEQLTGENDGLQFTRVPFDHPLWVLYSSGTTGLPKPIVHGQGGILLEHLKVMNLHLDVGAGDRVLWFTTTGWMMWNFLVGVLLTPASIVLYDGNPTFPSRDRLWDLAEDAGVSVFGTSPSYVAACQEGGVEPRARGRKLASLDAVGSTGSPLPPEAFRWVYDHLGERTWLFSTSGGTDVCTALVGGVPTLPVRPGELQARALGARVEAWSDAGRPLIGDVGELVITEPMPSMPICFWGDADGSRLRDAYFAHFPGVWRHGDWIEITEHGTAVISGRSDSTINRGGVRMGTSEIYRAALAVDDVLDALVVDIPKPGTAGWMPLFVVVREGVTLDAPLIAEIKRRIRRDCSPRHVPNEVLEIDEVPRTLSGKALEIPVKRILMGQPADAVVSRDSLANPKALDVFVQIAQTLTTTPVGPA